MKKLEEMLGGDAEGFATSTRVDPFELSAFSGLNGGLRGVVMTAAGRKRSIRVATARGGLRGNARYLAWGRFFVARFLVSLLR